MSKKWAYYNEWDPFAAAWLRELIKAKLITDGDVDERSIEDICPSELIRYQRVHMFAGIGCWDLALNQANWPDDTPIWTGSCPCQPFSAAGKGKGIADERHLWPALHYLIEQCQPSIVIGEQVASKDGLAWLDIVQADLEETRYTSGAVDICAAGFGAPHVRQRLYWVAYANGEQNLATNERGFYAKSCGYSNAGGVADANGGNASAEWQQCSGEQRQQPQNGRIGNMANAIGQGLQGYGRPVSNYDAEGWQKPLGYSSSHCLSGNRPSPTNGYWRDADWLRCTDEKWRPVEPATFPLADAGTIRNRVGMLRGAGNAITIAQAQGFVEAVMDCMP